MSKIGIKIAVIMILTAVFGLVIISLFLNYRLDENFNEFLYQEKKERLVEITGLIENRFEAGSSWSDIEKIINDLNSLNGFDIYIIDADKNTVLFNNQERKGMMGRGRNYGNIEFEEYNEIILKADQKKIAYLYWRLPPHKRIDTEAGSVFVEKMNRVIIITSVIIILITIIISLFFSRYLTVPILKMNSFANRVAGGDFSHRLDIRGNDELTELGDSLNTMTKKLNHLNIIRKKSTSDLAHELRTPLTSIKSYLEAIEDGVLKADRETIREMDEELDRLIRLVERLGRLTEAERKKVYMEKEIIDLNEILDNLIQRFKNKIKPKDMVISKDFSSEHLFVLGDGESLETIFSNLISNAVKYNDEPGIIKINLKREDRKALIEIIDDGIGIEKKDFPYIFERFYRADSSRSKKIEGTGIGLAVVKELIEAVSGQIKVENNQDGTTFTIYLPLAR